MRRPTWSLGLPVFCGAVGAGASLLLAAAGVDAAGGWPSDALSAALLAGYGVLLLVLGSAVVGALQLLPRRGAANGILFLLLAAAPWAVLAHMLLEGTDLVVGPGSPVRADPFSGGGFLVALVCLVGLNGAALGYRLWRPRVAGLMLVLAGTLLMAGVGFLLMRLGAAPGWGGAILAGAAGADGPAEGGATFLRWSPIYLAAVWLVGVGHWSVLSLAAPGLDGRPAEVSPTETEAAGASPGPAAGRAYAVLAVAYGALVVYGLLVPLEYRHRPFEEALEAFAATPYLALGVVHRADLVANMVLFVPLTFFTMGALAREEVLGNRALAAGLAVIGAAALSLVAEFLQLYFPPRTVSWNDVVAEGVGAVLGTVLWLVLGVRLTRWCGRLVRPSSPAVVARTLAAAYVVGLLVYQLFPFDVVLSAEEWATQAGQGKLVLTPFADWSRMSGAVAAIKGLLFVPVGYAVVVRGGRLRRPVLSAVALGVGVALAVEVLQTFVFSRYTSATDVVLAAGGALVGGALATRFGPAARKPLPTGPAWRTLGWLMRLAMTAACAAGLVYAKWSPFAVRWPEGGLADALAERVRVPFYYQYFNSEFEAAGQLLRDIAAPAVLAILATSLLPRRLPGRRAMAAGLAGAAAMGLELGQIVFPPHVPDPTTAILAAGGAVAGVYLYGPFVSAFVHPGYAVEEQEGTPDGAAGGERGDGADGPEEPT